MTSCETTGITVIDHFRGVTKMVELGSGAKRTVQDLMLTRYACNLIAQNGDTRKEEIAFAQSYFAVQTRKQKGIEAPADVVKNWKRSCSTIEFLGLWEQINNPDFKLVEFDQFKNESGNIFPRGPENWGIYFSRSRKLLMPTCNLI